MFVNKDMDGKSTLEKKMGCRLPMGLAETKQDGSSNNKCVMFVLIKIIVILIFIFFAFGVYFWMFYWLTNDGGSENENVIVVAKFITTSNTTLLPEHFEIVLRLRNDTTQAPYILRKKRNVDNIPLEANNITNLKINEFEKVRKIIAEHNILCNEVSHKQKCKELIDTLKLLTNNSSHYYKRKQIGNIIKGRPLNRNYYTNLNNTNIEKTNPIYTNLYSRSAKKVPKKRHNSNYSIDSSHRTSQSTQHNSKRTSSELTDTCLLARLMKHSYPDLHGIYDHIHNQPNDYQSHLRHIPPSLLTTFTQSRDINDGKIHFHPQDLDVAMDLVNDGKNKVQDMKTEETADNMTIHATQCPDSKAACDNGVECIYKNLWCDGNVDCLDASDEMQCSCKDRVDVLRICDGFFDCPFGEDEMGCYGCNENDFSCEDVDVNAKGSCFTREQRCNNVVDCPNRKDEMDCIMLAPSLHMTSLFAVSNTQGFLQRNFKGNWYSVCSNPYMWAHDACRRETGLVIRPPYIQIIPIDPTLKVDYINMVVGGLTSVSDTCLNSSAVYVTCPDLICGTRMQTPSQLLKTNIAEENNLFGRNKRYLLSRRPYLYYGKRGKRDVTRKTKINGERDRRADGRVVGGKASQPAAWPWVIALYRNGLFHCGGVIINQHWVMSAAHCVHKFWQHYFEVHSGLLRRLSFSPQEQNHRVTHVIVNHKYNQENMNNDLSLLLVKPSIQFSRWVRPICLPSPEVAGPNWMSGPQPGTICTAVGWGATVERGPDPDHLREVDVPIWGRCNHKDDEEGNEICAGSIEGGKDACQGDSGGPLLCTNPTNSHQWYVAGIVSHGDGCGRKGEPGAYTRVSLFVSWIKEHISSRSLPVFQPKQECPGFRCDSGISKCLPKKRMCDNVIDCLDGEDEVNCENKRPNPLFTEDINDANKEAETDFVTKQISETTTRATNYRNNTSDNISLEQIYSTISETTIETHTQKPTIETTKTDTSSESLEISTEKISSDPEKKESKESSEEESHHSLLIQSTTDKLSIEVDLDPNISINQSFDSDNKIVDSLAFNPTTLTEHSTESQSNINSLRLAVDNSSQSISNTTSNLSNNKKIERGDISQDKPLDNLITAGSENKITSTEDLILEAQPRKRYIFPSEFECARIQQTISYHHRCDQKADCEDGTDEFECTCNDYLATFENNLICDGNIDCSDGQDESDCYECPDNHFLCKSDKVCIPTKYVCDGKRQCPSGDDEIDCLSLTNGKDVVCDSNGKPQVNLQGYVTKKINNTWQILCDENMTSDLEDDAANYVCRYMGFSSANRHTIKYVNIKDYNGIEEKKTNRNKRNISNLRHVPIIYKVVNKEKNEARNIVIKEPEIINEQCVPNITKTCMALFVTCDPSLFTNFNNFEIRSEGRYVRKSTNTNWPWIAKLHIDGRYICTGVLIDLSWVLVSQSCLRVTINTNNFVTVILGSHKTIEAIKGPYEEIHEVDTKKELYRSKITLLHLREPANYSTMIKPMVVLPSHNENKHDTCITVGQDKHSSTFTLFLKEHQENCGLNRRCFTYKSNNKLCEQDLSHESALIISCHSNIGWYPAASFVVTADTCDFEKIVAFNIDHLKHEMKHHKATSVTNSKDIDHTDTNCLGVRCERGRCLKLKHVCDGISNCEDGRDESEDSCKVKMEFCNREPFNKECGCRSNELKCRNGRCIGKELFRNGDDECGDGTDEPGRQKCSDYLRTVMPSRLCDGILHCDDRSDEDPAFCKCFAKNGFDCRGGENNENYCVAMDMVCDGVHDCPNGRDEMTCLALNSFNDYPNGSGQVIACSYGVWYSKCYQSKNHTKSELEGICRQLGYLGGHAKQLEEEDMRLHRFNDIALDKFSNVILNQNTSIKLRSTDMPIARAIFNDTQNCYPLFLECL